MRILVTLLTLFQSVLLFSQTADVATGCAPLQVKFTPPSGVASFFWDFKDGATSVLASPVNTFSTPGTYNVEFRETPGGPVVGTVTITVYPKPVVGITAVPESGCVPLNVQFADTTQLAGDIQVLTRSWVFGDGFNGTGLNPTHTYGAVGAFTVSLELTTNYSTCNVTQAFPARIRTGIQPVVNFSTVPTPAVACTPPLNVTFTNTTTGGSGILTYAWTFGNGNTSNLVDPPAQVYNQLGTFNVTLTATDAVGCSATITKTVKVGLPDVGIEVPDTVCLGAQVTLGNSSDPGIYAWTFGASATPSTSNAQNPQVTFNAVGTQTITLTVTSVGNCSNTATKQVYVDEANANFTVSPTYSCSDPTVFNLNATSPFATEWLWEFSDGSTATTKNPTYTWTTPDKTGFTHSGLWLDTIRLTVTTSSGCSADFFRVDSIWRPNARFMPDVQHGCAPLSVVFSDSSMSREPIVQWTWLFDDGTLPVVANNDNPVTHVFTTPGDYRVRLFIRNSAGCVDTSYFVLIEVGEPIPGDFSADKTEVCPGDSVHFTSLTTDPRVDGWHFSSENDQLWHCYQDENPTWAYTQETGPLSVSLTTEYNGCFATVTRDSFIRVKGPIAKLHYKTTCDNTLEFKFTNLSMDADSVLVFTGDGDSTLVDTSFVHVYDSSGIFTVIMRAVNSTSGCPVSYDTAVVYPTMLKAMFELPDTVCGGDPQLLDARMSTDVNAACYKGYTWYFSFQRPIRTDQDTLSFVFGPSGLQTVSLEVEDINGCKDTLDTEIFIYNRYPNITASDLSICIPDTVSFADLSLADAGIVSWEWNFGDGGTSTVQNPTHIFNTLPPAGTAFDVSLRFEDGYGCPGFANIAINVYKPVSNIITLPSPPNICVGSSVAFAATDFTSQGSSLSWQWNFGNGQTATGQGGSATYNTAGPFTTKLVYTEIATGCKDSTTVPVNVQGFPQANFSSTVDGDPIICYPKNVLFTNTSTSAAQPLSVTWELQDGTVINGNQAATVFSEGGTDTITMIVATPFGCKDTVERVFTVVGVDGDFDQDKTLICVGDSIRFTIKDTMNVSSWSWDFGDGNMGGKASPVSHQYNFRPPSNTTIAKLILKGENDACTQIIEHPVNFSPVRADFSATLPACAGASVAFTNLSTQADQSLWNFGDGTPTSAQLNPVHIFANEGNYLVKLVVTDLPLGCVDSITKTISITGIPGLQMFGDTICPGDTAIIGILAPALPNATFVWSPDNLVLQPKNDDVVRVKPAQTTSFSVQIIDASGCRDSASVTVFVPVPFNGAADFDTIVAKGEPVLLPVVYDPNYDFTWTPLNPGDPPVVTSDTTVTYTLTVEDKWNCTEREYEFLIQIVPEVVYAPNAFTPDGDGNNDVFRLLADGDEELVDVLTLRVYSRWGEEVYQGRGALGSIGWDGKHNGEPSPSDVYAWWAEVRFLTGKTVMLKGDVTLLR
ncbi:MAG: PKD domain-containing protein [Saprospiraceae bacterium]|jgi:gliding motility-associated-like protein|nr:PKD domain-containing protein [Saprospiraceae bacterium]